MKYPLVAALLAVCCLAAAPDSDRGKVLGSLSAPVRLDVYSDFSCPACKSFHEGLLPEIIRDYVIPGKVVVVSHEYPLNIPEHKYSREAAEYATAAARLELYQPVADALFRTQMQWMSNGQVWQAIAAVLTPEQQKKVQELVKEPSVTAEVERDVEAGNREPVHATPTIILTHGSDRYPLPWPVNYNFFRSLVNGYLK